MRRASSAILLCMLAACQKSDSNEQARATPQPSASSEELYANAKPPLPQKSAPHEEKFFYGWTYNWLMPWPFVKQERGRSPSLGCNPVAEVEQAVDRVKVRGFRYQPCGEQHILVSPGERLPTHQEMDTATAYPALRELYGVDGGGFGVCCWEHPKRFSHLCFTVDLVPCSSSLDSVAQALVDAMQVQLPNVRVPISIRVPTLEPRCRADDRDCRPIPYTGGTRASSGERQLVRQDRLTACSHDGDCVGAGCGNECVSWPFSWIEGTCDIKRELGTAFCGCVDGACGWFTQPSVQGR